MDFNLESMLSEIEDAVNNKEEECKVCKGLGASPSCPNCGKVRIQPKTRRQLRNKRNNSYIPDSYLETSWSVENFKSLIDSEFIDKELNDILSEMERIHKIFKSGKVPNYSIILSAPSGSSKQTWAYSCLKNAEDKGLSIMPIIDTQEFKRFSVLSCERPKYKLFDKIEYDEYIKADVVFVSVVKDEYATEAFASIITLLDKRNRIGKPTFILSSFKSEILQKRDYIGMFNRYLREGEKKPTNKFPKLIEYIKE